MTVLLIMPIEQKKKDLLQEKKSDEFDVLLHGSTGHLEVRLPVLVHAYEMLIVNLRRYANCTITTSLEGPSSKNSMAKCMLISSMLSRNWML